MEKSYQPTKKSTVKSGFTVIELVFCIVIAAVLLVVFFIQKSNVDAMQRDEKSKIAINAMYYALEEGYFSEHKYYPETIDETVLTVMDPSLFTDPYGTNLGTTGSTYSYEPANCENGKCKEYTLRALLEKEDVFVKRSRSNN